MTRYKTLRKQLKDELYMDDELNIEKSIELSKDFLDMIAELKEDFAVVLTKESFKQLDWDRKRIQLKHLHKALRDGNVWITLRARVGDAQ